MKNNRVKNRKKREQKIKRAYAFARRVINIQGWMKNKPDPIEKDQRTRAQVINRMTNWQRNQAGRACKGVWSKLSPEELELFANQPHWKSA